MDNSDNLEMHAQKVGPNIIANGPPNNLGNSCLHKILTPEEFAKEIASNNLNLQRQEAWCVCVRKCWLEG
ncbi:MAG: hypothetical protein JAZ12_15410 [Candidatus Thiodiazotropha taylori]|nr:hypothetical protein [Candidatus Thiodiazotropha taylori]